MVALIEETLLLLEHDATAAGKLRIVREFKIRSLRARADRDALKQVFWNLCNNALRAMRILEAEGIEIRLSAKTTKVAAGIRVSVEDATGSGTIEASHLLLAVGRRPNTDDLGLENAGVALDSHGYIAVDEALRSSTPGIWAMGECNGRGAFTHTAYNDFEIVADNLLAGGNRRVSDRITAYGLFTDPPLGRVGMTEHEAVAAGHKVMVGSLPMSSVSRAYEKGETHGLMKLIVDGETKAILGAAILGVGGDEVVQSILDLMYAKAPYTILRQVVHIHPTVAEFTPVLLSSLKTT